ncbi:MAG: hypothetical protein Tsb005_15810 [Gammaproteobacteria bacterium]
MRAELIGVKNFSALEAAIQHVSHELNTRLVNPNEVSHANLTVLRTWLLQIQQQAGVDLTINELVHDTQDISYQELYAQTTDLVARMAQQVSTIKANIEDQFVFADETLQSSTIAKEAVQAIFEHEKHQALQTKSGRIIPPGSIYQVQDDAGKTYLIALREGMFSQLDYDSTTNNSVTLNIIHNSAVPSNALEISRIVKQQDNELLIKPTEQKVKAINNLQAGEQGKTLLINDTAPLGTPLSAWLKSREPSPNMLERVSLNVRLDIAAQLVQLVHQLHTANPPLIHQAINPDNVYLLYDEHAKKFTVSLRNGNELSMMSDDMPKTTTISAHSAPETGSYLQDGIAHDNFGLGAVLANIIAASDEPTAKRKQKLDAKQEQASKLSNIDRLHQLKSVLNVPVDLTSVTSELQQSQLTKFQQNAIQEQLVALLSQNFNFDAFDIPPDVPSERASIGLTEISAILQTSAHELRASVAQKTHNSVALQVEGKLPETLSIQNLQAATNAMVIGAQLDKAQRVFPSFVLDLNADELSTAEQARLKKVLEIESQKVLDSGSGHIIPAGTNYFIKNAQGQTEKVILNNTLISRESYRYPGQARFETVSDHVLGRGAFGTVTKAAKKYKLGETGELQKGDAKKIIKFVDQESQNDTIVQKWLTDTVAPEKIGFAQYDKFFQRENSDKPDHKGRIAQTALGTRYNAEQNRMVRTVAFTQPFFEGVSLDRLLQQGLPHDESFRLQLVKNLVEILVKLEQAGVVHHDFNPGNLIVNPNTAEVYLVDFGLARTVGSNNYSQFVVEMMPPELVVPGYRNQPGYDEFSMGIIILAVLNNFQGNLLDKNTANNLSSPLHQRVGKSWEQIAEGLKQKQTLIPTEEIFKHVDKNQPQFALLDPDERATIRNLVDILLSPDVRKRENLDLNAQLTLLETLTQKYPYQALNAEQKNLDNILSQNNYADIEIVDSVVSNTGTDELNSDVDNMNSIFIEEERNTAKSLVKRKLGFDFSALRQEDNHSFIGSYVATGTRAESQNIASQHQDLVPESRDANNNAQSSEKLHNPELSKFANITMQEVDSKNLQVVESKIDDTDSENYEEINSTVPKR